MTTTAAPPDKEERKILAVASAGHFLCHFFMLVFPALVMPISRGLSIPLARVLSMSFGMYLLYGVLAMGWGWISDHWGHKWAIGSGLLLAGLGFLAATSTRSPVLLSSGFALVGIGCSAYHPAGMALVSQGIRRRGWALGLVGVWGNLGIATVPFVMGVLNYALGWRNSLVAIGVVGMMVGLVTLVIPMTLERARDRMQTTPLDNRTATTLFLVFCVGLMFNGLIYRSFTVILPTFLEYRLGDLSEAFRSAIQHRLPASRDSGAFNTLAANLVATAVYLLGMVGQVIGGRVADRYSLKWSYLVFFLCALPFLIGTALIRNGLVVVTAGLFVLFGLGVQAIENSLVAYLTPARWRSVSYGVKFTLVFGVGALAVKLMGAVETRYGLERALWPIPIILLALITMVCVFLYLSRGKDIRH